MNLQGATFDFPWEIDLMKGIQEWLGTAGASVLSFFSMFGEELVLILILGFIYWCYDKNLGKKVGLGVLLGLVWGPMIKNVVLRRRPYFDHEEIRLFRAVEPGADIYDISAQGYSFPSGHSANAVSMYGGLAAYGKKKWLTILAVLLPLLVGISRVAVGAHYPTDVLAGWALGGIAILLVSLLEKKISSTPLRYALLLITAVPGFFYCKSADYFTGVGLLIGFMAGTLLEDKKVRFENAKTAVKMILRLVCGLALYFVLNTALKLPFSKAFLDGGTLGALLVRCARYAVISFVEFGVYPLLFGKIL